MRVPEPIDTALRTAVGVAVLPAGILVCSSGAVVAALLGASNRQTHWFYLSFARLCMRVGATQLEVHGIDHIRPGQVYVVVPNHESNWDPPSVVAALPDLVLRFIAKREVMRIPIFGHALRLTGNVRVERDRTHVDVDRIRTGMQRRDPEVSVLFFAEGTRTRTGSMRKFKMGAFATAIDEGLAILPVGIAGSFRVFPPEILRLRRGPVAIEVGAPIPVDGLRPENRAALRDQTYEAVVKLRARARQRIRDRGIELLGTD